MYDDNMSFKLPAGQHFGAISKSYDVAGFTLTKTAYAPNFETPIHSHERACFCLVLRGGYVESYGKTALDCKPASLLFRPPEEPHSDHFHNARSDCFLIEVESGWLDCLREHAATFNSPTTTQASSAAWLALRAYEEFNHLDEVSPLAVQGLTLAIAAELAREPIKIATNTPPRWLRQMKEILHAHFSENLTLACLSEMVGVHPVYLAAAYRKCYRCTIGDYVRQLRVEYACRELLSSDIPLVEIALSAGFSSQSHFSRTFKQFTGMSPAQYRAFRKSP
jgi:AraC family transcriptional regulator